MGLTGENKGKKIFDYLFSYVQWFFVFGGIDYVFRGVEDRQERIKSLFFYAAAAVFAEWLNCHRQKKAK